LVGGHDRRIWGWHRCRSSSRHGRGSRVACGCSGRWCVCRSCSGAATDPERADKPNGEHRRVSSTANVESWHISPHAPPPAAFESSQEFTLPFVTGRAAGDVAAVRRVFAQSNTVDYQYRSGAPPVCEMTTRGREPRRRSQRRANAQSIFMESHYCFS